MMALKDLTAVIKTFRRPSCLAAAVDELHRSWPGIASIVVLDDGPREQQVPDDSRYRLLRTEENIGLSEGRNRLVDAIRTPLVALFDDDFQAGPESRLDLLAELVRSDRCDLIGAAIREAEGFWNGGWVYRWGEGRKLYKLHAAYRREIAHVDGEQVELYFVDQVNNAFVARTDFVRSVRWDPRLKLREHDDFALRSSQAGRIAYTPRAVIDHVPYDPPGYRKFRTDTDQYRAYFLSKWNVTGVVKEAEWGHHSRTIPHPRVLP